MWFLQSLLIIDVHSSQSNLEALFWRYGLGCVLLSCLVPVFSQTSVWHFNHLGVRDNLTSESYNYWILRDSRDHVWISSIHGLNRFDGRSIRQYIPGDSLFNLTDGQIQSMFFEDSRSDIWFSTSEAIQRYDRALDQLEQCYLVEHGDTLLPHHLFFVDSLQRRLWVSSERGLYLHFPDRDSLTLLGNFDTGYRSQLIKLADKPTYLLVTLLDDGGKVHLFRESAPDVFEISEVFAGTALEAEAFHVDRSGLLWVASQGRLIRVDLNSGAHQDLALAADGLGAEISALARLNDEEFLICADGGLFKYHLITNEVEGPIKHSDEGRLVPFQIPVEFVYVDPKGTVWLSTAGQGIFYTQPGKVKFGTLLQEPEISAELQFARMLCEDLNGDLLCLTRDGVVRIDRSGTSPNQHGFQRARCPGKMLEEDPFFVAVDFDGRQWVGTLYGLYSSAPGADQFGPISQDQGLGFFYSVQLPDGRRWVTTSGGLYEVSVSRGLEHIPLLDSQGLSMIHLMSDEILLVENNQDLIYVVDVSEGGAQLIDSLPFQDFATGMATDRVQEITWIAASKGLHRLTSGPQGYLVQHDGQLTAPNLSGIVVDEDGVLWISSNQGILRYHPTDGTVRHFLSSDGLQSAEFNFHASFRASDGTFYFGGVDGINYFRPEDIVDLSIPARPLISEIMVNNLPWKPPLSLDTYGADQADRRRLTFAHDQNTLTFFFAPREYSDPTSIRFRYQLIGVDASPVLAGQAASARYPNLGSGMYDLRLEATNSDGVWSDQVASLPFVIRPPWYETTLFRVCVVALLLLLVYVFFRARLRTLRRQETFLRKEAEYKQLVAETETAVLRLQMNPHFIFNSLNSIQSFMMSKDMKGAEDYLTRFAGLMRQILRKSTEPFHTVEEEVQFLQEYLEIESIRFDKKLSYAFQIDPELEIDYFCVPTMILQPFVENAIWHGIAGRATGGQITIRIRQEEGGLRCEVEDDGVGRSSKARDRATSDRPHAQQITQRRLDMLGHDGERADFRIEDLVDASGRPAGTRAVIFLPLQT